MLVSCIQTGTLSMVRGKIWLNLSKNLPFSQPVCFLIYLMYAEDYNKKFCVHQNEKKILQATNFVSLCCFLSLSKLFPITFLSISDNVCSFNAFVKSIYKNTPTVYPLSCQQNHWEDLKVVLSSNPSRLQRLGYIVCLSSQCFLHYSFGAITAAYSFSSRASNVPGFRWCLHSVVVYYLYFNK